MRSFFVTFIAFLSLALAGELEDTGVMNHVYERTAADVCGQNAFGDYLYCINGDCCVGSEVWSCTGASEECCSTGYTCPTGYTCYLSSGGDQYCVSGSSTLTAGSSSPATSTGGVAGATSKAFGPRQTAGVVAALVPLALPLLL